MFLNPDAGKQAVQLYEIPGYKMSSSLAGASELVSASSFIYRVEMHVVWRNIEHLQV